jgi:hypothetical protein
VLRIGITFDADPDPACHFDADPEPDPDPTFHFEAVPDSRFQIKVQNFEKLFKKAHFPQLVICKLMRSPIWIQLITLLRMRIRIQLIT